MTFEEAIRKSIRNYMKGKLPEATKKAKGELTYDLKFFDELEKMFTEDEKGSKKKSKADKASETVGMEEI